MKYFTLEELTRSYEASRRGIKNIPTEEEKRNLVKLTYNVLDPLRERYGSPIIVNSGYRSEELNKAVGGVSTSYHRKGMAADITTGTKEGNRRLFWILKNSCIPFTELIDEKNYSWLHVAYDEADLNREILHL